MKTCNNLMAELSSIYVDIYRIELFRKNEEQILSGTLTELINSDKFAKLKQEVFALYSESCYIKKVPAFLQPLFIIFSNRFFNALSMQECASLLKINKIVNKIDLLKLEPNKVRVLLASLKYHIDKFNSANMVYRITNDIAVSLEAVIQQYTIYYNCFYTLEKGIYPQLSKVEKQVSRTGTAVDRDVFLLNHLIEKYK